MTRALSDSMVKACLFLLVAVAKADDATCAASSPGCPSKMQADANTLLQTGVRIGDELAPGRTDEEEEKNTYTDEATNPHKVSWMQEGMNTQQLKEKLIDNSKGKGRRDVLIQLSRFVNTLGNATKHFNSSNADNLKEVITILRAVMYKSMNLDHTEDQTELNQAFAEITTCNTELGKAITDIVGPPADTMATARSTHTTCRSEEGGLETIKVGKWNEMRTHIAGISTPPSVTNWPVTPTYDALVPYFSTGYAEWFVRHKQTFDTKNNAYVSANTNWTNSKIRCDRDQTTFENNFCAYNAVLDTTCLNHNTCHISASSGASTTTARVEVTEAARKEAYKAGEEIVCRINALLANRAYSECDNLTVDTSNYSIVYPTADAKDSCVKEAEKPCSNTWKDTEYNGLPSNAPSTTCIPCQSPSMAPTVAPTTQPIQATTVAEQLATLEENNFNDRGYSSLQMQLTYTYTLANGYLCALSGWQYTRQWAKGFLRNEAGNAQALVSGLLPGQQYAYAVYQYASTYAGTNGLQVNGIAQADTTSSESDAPTGKGIATATAQGEIIFIFPKKATTVHLSGLAIARQQAETSTTISPWDKLGDGDCRCAGDSCSNRYRSADQTEDQCKQECGAHEWCKAFASGNDDGYTNACFLYSAAAQDLGLSHSNPDNTKYNEDQASRPNCYCAASDFMASSHRTMKCYTKNDAAFSSQA